MAASHSHGVATVQVGESEFDEHVSAAVEPERVEFDDGLLACHGG
jgi:hypothetical protein